MRCSILLVLLLLTWRGWKMNRPFSLGLLFSDASSLLAVSFTAALASTKPDTFLCVECNLSDVIIN